MVEIRLLRAKPFFLRLEIILLLLVFPFTVYPCVNHVSECWIADEPEWPSNSSLGFIIDHVDAKKLEPYVFQVCLPIVTGLLLIGVLIVPYWSVKMRVKMHFTPATEENATHAVCILRKYSETMEIVPIKRDKKDPYIVFQCKQRRLVNGEWIPLKYPTDLTVREYLANKGLSDAEAAKRLLRYGQNNYTVPIPGFLELMVEQLISPMSVLRMFMFLLNLLNDYFLSQLMSLGISVSLEAGTARARQKNLLELRGAEAPPILIYVKREGTWKKITSDLLMPGDVVLLHKECMCPCDLLVMKGRAVVNEAMLTGESTPQVKDPVTSLSADVKLDVVRKHRHFVLFGGTNIEQLLPDGDCAGLPETGVVCQALATGLGSTQGKLIRTILHSSQNNKMKNRDSLCYILFMSIFALIASGYVWYHGKQAGYRNTFALILETAIIFLTTVPVDIQVQLNVLMNTAMIGLSRFKVFCTEPHRIAFSGQISCCCFDKTGTLTSEEYYMIGVDDMNEPPASPSGAEIVGTYYKDPSNMPLWALRVIGGCHSLVRGNYGQLIGDSLEATGFTAMGFKLTADGGAEHPRGNIRPIKAFHFQSDLMRMSVVCSIDGEKTPYALMKGAPEAIADLLESVPPNYHETNMHYTRQGCRVLAMAYKPIDPSDAHDPHLDRSQVEKGMRFVGFMIFSAAIKRGSEDAIVHLLQSSHRCIIITGDNPLTACHVAKVLHMITKKPAIHDLTVTDENGAELKSDEGYEPCFTGRALEKLSEEELETVVNRCNIFARMSPRHKALVVMKLQSLGHTVLMCGDGTNDVNALKNAAVGVGLVDDSTEAAPAQVDVEGDMTPKLGAASIASPFVSKRPTITCCVDLIRFGRSTLSNALDMFKQLALASLISAYSSTVLQLEHVRFGDRQTMIMEGVIMIADFSVMWAVPTRTLSKERPFPGQFNSYLVLSVVLQFGVHLLFLYLTHQLVFSTGFKIDRYNARAKFTPTLMNTAIFLLKSEMKVLTNVINYRGTPFMQSMLENKMLLVGVFLALGFIFLLILDIHPFLRMVFQLVEFPSREFQMTLALYCLLDAVLTLLVERVCLTIFSAINKKDYAGLVSDDVAHGIEDYVSNDDDVLVESAHDFGLAELMKQQVEMQKAVQDKSRANAIAERKKREAARKAREEAEQYMKHKK